MNKREIIERTKKAFSLYKENKIYQALKELHPVAQTVKTEKVQKLYKVLVLKAKQLLQELFESKEYNKIEEIQFMFFNEIYIPEINTIFERTKEEREKLLQQLQEEELKIETEDYFDEEPTFTSESAIEGEDEENLGLDAEHFKLSSFSEDEMGQEDVTNLIQKGVSLYEVGDYENALEIWQQALQLQPDNEFIKEYIENAKRELNQYSEEYEEQFDTETQISENIATPQQEETKPQDVEIVFEESEIDEELKRIVAVARSGDFERAKSLLNKLRETGAIEEEKFVTTENYISKLEKELGSSFVKNKIKALLEENLFEEALETLERHKNKFSPEEKNKIEQFIKAKKQEYEFSQPLELELEEESPAPKRESARTTRSATHKTSRQKPPTIRRQVKKKKTIWPFLKTTFIFLLLLVILAVVVFYGFKVIKSDIQQNTPEFDIKTLKLEEEKKLKKRKFNTFVKEAKAYFDMGEYLFAYYTFLHAERYGNLDEQQKAFLLKARQLMANSNINKNAEIKAGMRYFKKKQYEKAIPHFKNALAVNPEDLNVKEKLFQCYKNLGIEYSLKFEILKAKTYFKYALVLNRYDEEIPKHIVVLDRYLKGKINKRLLTQWFYFFK